MNDRARPSADSVSPPVGRAPVTSGRDRSGDLAVGRRVAHHRRQRGLSQPEFARLVGRSTAWVSGVERGKYHLDRLPLLVKLADALDVTVGDLLPEAVRWRPEETATISDDPTGLVAVLGTYPVIGALYGRPPPLVDRDDLEARIDALAELEQAADHRAAAAALVEILPMVDTSYVLAAAARQPAATLPEGPFLLWTRAYSIAARVLYRLGQFAAAWVAIDRAIRGAARCGDPTLTVSVVLRAARLFVNDGRPSQAQAAAESVIAGMEATVVDPTAAPGDLAMAGAAHLILADLAASQWNRGRAHSHMQQADELAARLPPDQHFYDTDFGADEVTLHRVIVAVGLQDAGDAIALAKGLDSDELTPERRSVLLLHWARAEILCRTPDRALALLVRADRLNPDLTVHHSRFWAAIEDLGTMVVRIHDTGELARLQSRVRRPR